MKIQLLAIPAAILLSFALLSCASEPETTETEEPVIEKTDVEEEEMVAEEEKIEEKVEEKIEEAKIEEKPVYQFEVIRLQFRPNSAQFLDTEKAMLLKYASILEKYPEFNLQIKGHTAKVGSEETSQSLSEERARVVADFILSRTKIKESRLIIVGMGSREPVADNATEKGRMANRRVEVSLVE